MSSRICKAMKVAFDMSLSYPDEVFHVMTKRRKSPVVICAGFLRQKLACNGWSTNTVYRNGEKIIIGNRSEGVTL